MADGRTGGDVGVVVRNASLKGKCALFSATVARLRARRSPALRCFSFLQIAAHVATGAVCFARRSAVLVSFLKIPFDSISTLFPARSFRGFGGGRLRWLGGQPRALSFILFVDVVIVHLMLAGRF